MSKANQLDLFLPKRPPDEILIERLAAHVEEINEHDVTPERRVQLQREIERLRALLGMRAP